MSQLESKAVVADCCPVGPCFLSSPVVPTSYFHRTSSVSLRPAYFLRPSFTLVELLVVVVIIGILASLITVAAVRALGTADEARIKIELDNLAAAIEQYKNQYGSYPPNLITTGNVQLNHALVERHIKKAFPRIDARPAPDSELTQIRKLWDPSVSGALNPPLSPAEALVFWLGGFSADPEHPFTGPGGPGYALDQRDSLFDFDAGRVLPSTDTNGNPRSVTITVTGRPQVVIPMFIYHPAKLQQPYVYFDTSRYLPIQPNPQLGKFVSWPGYQTAAGTIRAYRQQRNLFVNPNSFQIISAGTDDEWGEDLSNVTPEIFYNTGPFVAGHADNLVNFSQRNLEASQP